MFTSRLEEEVNNNNKAMGWIEFIVSSGSFFLLTIITMALLGVYSNYMDNLTWFFLAFSMMFTMFSCVGTLLFYGFLKIDHPKYNRRTAAFSGFLQLFIALILAPWGYFLLLNQMDMGVSRSDTPGIWGWVIIQTILYSLLFVNSIFLLGIGVVGFLKSRGEEIEIVAVEET